MVDAVQAATTASSAPATGMMSRREAVLKPVADKLGLSADDLVQALRSGKSLSQLAADKGVSHDDLVAAIADGLKQNAPAGSNMDFTKMAERIADGQGPGGAGAAHHHHHHHHHVQSTTASSDGSSGVTSSTNGGLPASGLNL